VSRVDAAARIRGAFASAVRRRERVRRLTGIGGRIVAGRMTYFDERPTVKAYAGDTGLVRLGAFCSVASDVEFVVGGEHRTDWVTTFPLRAYFAQRAMLRDGHPAPRPDIEIGNDVWIGTGACILSGTTIGDGAVIGAHAVVKGEVRPYAIVVGNPAAEIRRRFDDETVEKLLALRWWEWPLEDILEQTDLLCSSDVEALLSRGRSRTPSTGT
jgi:acetyltransferase-like isoleucine patch superfamily enzyme